MYVVQDSIRTCPKALGKYLISLFFFDVVFFVIKGSAIVLGNLALDGSYLK